MFVRRSVLVSLFAVTVSPSSARARTANAQKLVAAAENQIGVTRIYDPAYIQIGFPGGDVPIERGVCTDVIVRAYRAAFGFDLQAAVNADMRMNFGSYPKLWGLAGPDKNIDHRRVPNLEVFFTRQKARLPVPETSGDWQPGDLVTMTVAGGRPHIGLISNSLAAGTGRRTVIHNIGLGTRADDILDVAAITGRFRLLIDG